MPAPSILLSKRFAVSTISRMTEDAIFSAKMPGRPINGRNRNARVQKCCFYALTTEVAPCGSILHPTAAST